MQRNEEVNRNAGQNVEEVNYLFVIKSINWICGSLFIRCMYLYNYYFEYSLFCDFGRLFCTLTKIAALFLFFLKFALFVRVFFFILFLYQSYFHITCYMQLIHPAFLLLHSLQIYIYILCNAVLQSVLSHSSRCYNTVYYVSVAMRKYMNLKSIYGT